MASRATLRRQVTGYLGTVETDPEYRYADGTSKLDTYLDDAYHALVEDLRLASPELYVKAVALPAVGANSYPLAGPAPDLLGVVRLTATDSRGARFRPAPVEALNEPAGGLCYALVGLGSGAQIVTGAGAAADLPLYLVYDADPAWGAGDAAEPAGVDARFHDVLALAAAQLAFAVGGESRFPPEFAERLLDRRGQLIFWAGRRAPEPDRVRSY